MTDRPTFPFTFFVHEIGHMVIGFVLGVYEQGVIYTRNAGEPFQAWLRGRIRASPRNARLRDFWLT